MEENRNYIGKPIGVDKLTFFPITKENDTETTYGAAVKVARTISINLNPTMVDTDLDSDDTSEDNSSILTAIEVTVNVSQLTDEIRAKLLGHKLDAKGGIITKSNDVAPYGAIAWEELLSRVGGGDQHSKRVVLYRGRFKEFAETAETKKKSSVTLQTHTITGTFYPRPNDGALKYSMRSDTGAYSSVTFNSWFTSPQETSDTKEVV
ncbi:MAG: hypothetical protein RR398_00800 [Clostridia bacterium]